MLRSCLARHSALVGTAGVTTTTKSSSCSLIRFPRSPAGSFTYRHSSSRSLRCPANPLMSCRREPPSAPTALRLSSRCYCTSLCHLAQKRSSKSTPKAAEREPSEGRQGLSLLEEILMNPSVATADDAQAVSPPPQDQEKSAKKTPSKPRGKRGRPKKKNEPSSGSGRLAESSRPDGEDDMNPDYDGEEEDALRIEKTDDEFLSTVGLTEEERFSVEDNERDMYAQEVKRRVEEGSVALIHVHPALAMEFDVQKNKEKGLPELDTISIHSPVVATWRCQACHGTWECGVFVRCILKNGCPSCASLHHPVLAVGRPDLIPVWSTTENDPFNTPWSVQVDSKAQAMWKCIGCGLGFRARVKDMVKGSASCTMCGRPAGRQPRAAERRKRKQASITSKLLPIELGENAEEEDDRDEEV